MPNLIQEAKQQIETVLAAAYEKAAEKGTLPAGAVLSGTVEIPKDTANGDFAANHAMTGARAMHMAPLPSWISPAPGLLRRRPPAPAL